jgi:AraC family transcriptional regulator, arabinose operon regulatory protein
MSKPETPHPPTVRLRTGHFREGRGYSAWRSSGTSDWLLILTLGGRGRFGCASNGSPAEAIARRNDLVLIRPHTLHDYGVEPTLSRWELLWTHFHPRAEWVEWLNWPEAPPGLMRLHLTGGLARRVARRFAEVHHFATGANQRRDALAMNALEEIFLWCDQINPRVGHRRDERISAAMELLCRNIERAITLEDLANRSGLSASRFSHLFREQVGVTPMRFLETQRLDRAAALLELTQLSVKEIARKVGFENPFYFTLRFKSRTGMSPRAFRGKTGAA